MVLLMGMLPTTVSAAVSARLEAKAELYEYLKTEYERLGQTIRDEDYYQMFTDKIQRNAKVEKILAA